MFSLLNPAKTALSRVRTPGILFLPSTYSRNTVIIMNRALWEEKLSVGIETGIFVSKMPWQWENVGKRVPLLLWKLLFIHLCIMFFRIFKMLCSGENCHQLDLSRVLTGFQTKNEVVTKRESSWWKTTNVNTQPTVSFASGKPILVRWDYQQSLGHISGLKRECENRSFLEKSSRTPTPFDVFPPLLLARCECSPAFNVGCILVWFSSASKFRSGKTSANVCRCTNVCAGLMIQLFWGENTGLELVLRVSLSCSERRAEWATHFGRCVHPPEDEIKIPKLLPAARQTKRREQIPKFAAATATNGICFMTRQFLR